MSTRPDSPGAADAVTRSPWRHVWRVCLVIALIIVAVIGAALWYASTPAFEGRIRHAVVAKLEQTTGGWVQLEGFRWNLLHLEFEADNLTIHGLEGFNEVPYAHIDRLFVRVKIISFFRAEIGLNSLEADHPVFHLIVYPDGSTNQPHPAHPAESNGSAIDELFRLAIDRTEVRNGILLLNQQAIPFNLSANNLGAVVTWSPLTDHYLGTIEAEDITTQRGRQPAVHSRLDVQADLSRNAAKLNSLRLQSGSSLLTVSGTLHDFAHPQWEMQAAGTVDIREVAALTEVPGLGEGVAQLKIQGHGDKSTWSIDGNAGVTNASYRTSDVHASGAQVQTDLHFTQDELSLPHLRVVLAGGGAVQGELHLLQWDSSTEQQGLIKVKVLRMPLTTILSAVAPAGYRDLGFDAAATGDAGAQWKGDASSLVVTAAVSLNPLHPQRETAQSPLYGTVNAQYQQRTGKVNIRELAVQTAASRVNIAGVLGVYPLEAASEVRVQLETSNLGEFDKTLTDLGVSANGKQGIKVVPAELHGSAQFEGTFSGSLAEPDIQGKVHATDFNAVLPVLKKSADAEKAEAAEPVSEEAPTLHFDELTAEGEYSPDQITVQSAILLRGSSKITVSGELASHHVGRRLTTWDEHSHLQAEVQVQNAAAGDLLHAAGENLPVSGTVSMEAHATGELDHLSGSGHLSVAGGAIYDEPYHSLNADLHIAGEEIDIGHLVFLQDGGKLTGGGGYNIASNSFQFATQGSGFDLAKMNRLKSAKYPISGVLAFNAHGNGTPQAPAVDATLHVTGINMAGAATGYIDADAHTQNRLLLLKMTAHLNSAVIEASGQTELYGDLETQAKLTVAQFDVDPILRAFNMNGIVGHSSIGATFNVHGPLQHPRQLDGDALISQFSVALENVPLQSDGPVHVRLTNGVAHLDPVHITGEDTNLHAQGSLGLFDEARALHGHANGSISMTLAQTLDTDLISSGRIDFNVNAAGTAADPSLTGQVKFTNVNISLEGYTNGLSRMNGVLAFDQDRLDFKDVTAYSGGGLIKVGGFLTYQHGLYGDLTATAHDVRIRYPQGVTSAADIKLRLQGTQSSMLLSGSATVTRFSISQQLDLAALSSATGTVSLPTNPDTPTNRIRLDIHITSAPSLDFQNSYAKLAGDVDLRIRGTIAQPSILGRVTITEGSATFAGTRYELQHGDIYFSNPIRIDPVIDLDAMAHVEDYDITIGLHGTASHPTPTFRSEPPLSEQDIFSLLAMGRTQEEQQIYSSEQQSAGVNSTADALLGGALNATVSSRIQKLFGGGSVKIDPTFVSGTGNATARITVEQQVSKNATLTYATNVNSTAEQLIQGEFRLTENLSVLAVRDESGVFSLIFKLHRRYR
ncbi:translocation/assembly module TamB domain-containing protein [Paracidobacterium acidisoli]|uniref:Translocation/assembly module TamB n=1 Tax=Paracidobacterium acidisoli TaxID=2303751 RepID=A0A372IU17_9BACT|nr:translocation/assembly module TamB domain-containing protein [Paracidobacterium acidisoli]MBT9329841.1 translocation/assembly module TamB [Paracidobacterium acidisoli]